MLSLNPLAPVAHVPVAEYAHASQFIVTAVHGDVNYREAFVGEGRLECGSKLFSSEPAEEGFCTGYRFCHFNIVYFNPVPCFKLLAILGFLQPADGGHVPVVEYDNASTCVVLHPVDEYLRVHHETAVTAEGNSVGDVVPHGTGKY